MHVVLARYCYRKSSVRLSMTLIYRGRMCWDSSKLITRIINLDLRSLEPQHRQSSPRGDTSKIRVEYRWARSFQQKTSNISETGQDRTKVTIYD